MILTEAVIKVKGFCLLELKKNYNYFYQVQCTIFYTKHTWCFVVMTKTLRIQLIDYNIGFLSTVLTKLKAFYFTTILPRLVSPRPAVREPSEWITTDWEEKNNFVMPCSPAHRDI